MSAWDNTVLSVFATRSGKVAMKFILFRRAFTSKLRNRGNIILTLLVPPVLAAIIGWALYFTDEGAYDFASAFHIPTYIFIVE